MTTNTDIVVVGAGPAGCAVARAYALAGQRVVLLEAEEQGGSQVLRRVHRSQAPV